MSGEIIDAPEAERSLSYSKRGIDIDKVNFIMSREQERDLALIYRIDQLQLYLDDPTDCRKQYNAQRKPSDPPLLQGIWEAHKNYMQAKKDGDGKQALEWFKQQTGLVVKVQDIRREAMDRLFAWKKQAEAQGQGLDNLTNEALEALRDA